MPDLDRARRIGLWTGLVLLAVSSAAAFLTPDEFFRSYLLGYLFWTGLALGCFGVVMLHHLVGGRWGFAIRRVLESGTRTLPLMALLFLPLLAGLPRVYEWAHPAPGGHGAAGGKAAYLNIPFFTGRGLLYFAVWTGLAYLLNRLSAEQDRTGHPDVLRRMQNLSAPGLVLYGLTVSFASIDWVMSLEPHWYSTIYGAIFLTGQALSALSFSVALIVLLSAHKPLADVATPDVLQDLGNLMLAFVMLWAYVSFSQFLIIWAGNLPEETPFYVRRMQGGWEWVALSLVIFHFAAPFAALLMRDIKRRARAISVLAAGIIFMRLVDLFWLTRPALHPGGFTLHWMDFAIPAGMGGLWLAWFLRQFERLPMVPLHDPRLEAAENG